MSHNAPWEMEIVFVILSRASPNDRLMWSPPLKSELRHLNAPKRVRISEFLLCSSSMCSVFGFGFGFGLLVVWFLTFSSRFVLSVNIKTTNFKIN